MEIDTLPPEQTRAGKVLSITQTGSRMASDKELHQPARSAFDSPHPLRKGRILFDLEVLLPFQNIKRPRPQAAQLRSSTQLLLLPETDTLFDMPACVQRSEFPVRSSTSVGMLEGHGRREVEEEMRVERMESEFGRWPPFLPSSLSFPVLSFPFLSCLNRSVAGSKDWRRAEACAWELS